MIFGHRSAKRRHGGVHTRARQGDNVHITLCDDKIGAVLAHRFTGGGGVIQGPSLVEERRIGGIDVFRGLRIAHDPPAKRNDAAALVGDREHRPVAKKRIGRTPVLGFAQQSGFQQKVFLDALPQKRRLQPAAIGRVS